LIRGLAKLARVDWRVQGLEGFGKPEGFHERQVDRWLAHWDQFRFRDIPGLDEAAAWLRTHRPEQWTSGIMHGDYAFLNVMFRHGPQPRLAAIVDWEMSTIGDPLLDVAWLLGHWPTSRDDEMVTEYVDYTGMPLRDEMLATYEEECERPIENFVYYQVLASFKSAIVLEGGYARFLKGETDNPKLEKYNDSILRSGEAAMQLIRSAR
jgi:aminoglycoside phosphotransferase (APT) family kinase protein